MKVEIICEDCGKEFNFEAEVNVIGNLKITLGRCQYCDAKEENEKINELIAQIEKLKKAKTEYLDKVNEILQIKKEEGEEKNESET